jgi:hypothetical protein
VTALQIAGKTIAANTRVTLLLIRIQRTNHQLIRQVKEKWVKGARDRIKNWPATSPEERGICFMKSRRTARTMVDMEDDKVAVVDRVVDRIRKAHQGRYQDA